MPRTGTRIAVLALALAGLAAGTWAVTRGPREGGGPTGTCVVGGCVTRAGRPVADAAVEFARLQDSTLELRRWGGRHDDPTTHAWFAQPVATVRSDEEGRYRAEALPRGDYAVLARPRTGTVALAYVDLDADGERHELDLPLPEGDVRLRGRVTRRGGSAFRGEALLRVLPEPGASGDVPADGLRVPLSLDEEGAFDVTALPRGRAHVSVRAPGALVATSDDFDLPHAKDFAWAVDGDFRLVAVTVVARDTHRPVAGAVVVGGGRVGSRIGSRGRARAASHTGADGRVLLSVPAGPVHVSASAPDVLWGSATVAPDATEATLELAPAERVAGRLVDPVGNGVAGVIVGQLRRETRYWRVAGPAVRTGPEGRFELFLPRGPLLLGAFGAEWLSDGLERALLGHTVPDVLSVEGGRADELLLQATPAATISGTVRDAGGTAVAGAVVTADPVAYGVPRREVATDAGGAFLLGGLVAGLDYDLIVTAPGLEPRVLERVAVASDGPPLDVPMAPGRSVRVRVTEEGTGEPVAGATVLLGRTRSFGFSAAEGATPRRTDSDGVASVGPLPPGAVGVRVDGPDLEAYDDDGDRGFVPLEFPGVNSLAPGLPTAGEPIPVTVRRGARIDGTVLLADGSPGAWASVEARDVAAERRDRGRTFIADASGRFEATGLHAGRTYRVRAQVARGGRLHGAERTVVAGTTAMRLVAGRADLDAPASLLVLDDRGNPVPGGEVLVHLPNGTKSSSWRDGAAVLFDDVSDGPLDLEAREPLDASGVPLPLAPRRVTFPKGPRDALVMRLEPGRSIRATVLTDGGNAAAAGVTVRAIRSVGGRPTDGWDGPDAVGLAGPDGGLLLEGLLDAEYDLHLVSGPPLLPFEPVRARPGVSGEVVLRPRLGSTVTVTVLDPQGGTVGDADVFVHRGPGRPWVSRSVGLTEGHARTDRRGVARVPAIDPSLPYTLEVAPPGARDDVVAFQREKWVPRDETVTLEAGSVLRGTIRTPAGAPVPGAAVWWGEHEGWEDWASAVAGPDGRYEIRGLPPRKLRAVVTADVATGEPSWTGRRHAPGTPIPVGGGVLDLVLDPGRTLKVRIVGPWTPGDGGKASLRAETLPPGERQRVEVAADGRFRFSGLREGVLYSLWIGPTRDGMSVHRAGLRATDEAVEVRFARGLSIRGRVVNPPGITTRYVVVSGGIVWFTTPVREDGTFAAEGLPEGKYDLRAWALMPGDDKRTVQARARVQAGATMVVLTLR